MCSIESSIKLFSLSCDIVDRSLFLIKASLLNDRSPEATDTGIDRKIRRQMQIWGYKHYIVD